jgi:hypothetical protein
VDHPHALEYEPDPVRKAPQLVESSIGLDVDSPLTDDIKKSFVRYDVDHRPLAPLSGVSPAHLNVLQPGRVEDRVHYPIPLPKGGELDEWPLRPCSRSFSPTVFAKTFPAGLP